jgi:UDP-N-acetyl-D-glucosamine dehydrogenase
MTSTVSDEMDLAYAETALPDLLSRVGSPTVAVVGLGYVGLPTAVGLAHHGTRVVGFDVSRQRLAAIREQTVDLTAADHERLAACLHSDLLLLTDHADVLRRADAIIICVPTPVDDHLSPDLTALRAACSSVVSYAVPGQVIVLTSTTYVGCTNDLLVKPLQARNMTVGRDVFVAFSPERINPGADALPQESVPRVVGGHTEVCAERARRLIRSISQNVHLVSSPEAAEMCKLQENIFRAVNIALANELADVAGRLGLDPIEVLDAAATKPYGFMSFRPGPGVGGHCIPCDPHYLLWQLRGGAVQAPLIEQTMTSIAKRPFQVVDRVVGGLADAGVPRLGARILIAGVTYKPGVEDVRESPALVIIERLLELGMQVEFTDPLVNTLHAGGQRLAAQQPTRELAERVDFVVLHTRQPDDDLEWLRCSTPVLDTSYGLGFDNCVRL